MKKFIIASIFFALLLGCKDKEPRTSLFGGWNVNEVNNMTGEQKNYQTNIIRDNIDPEFYLIYNFHDISNDQSDAVRFYEDENGLLVIVNQIIGNSNIWVEGTGEVAPDFSNIIWKYTINDGIEQFVVANYY